MKNSLEIAQEADLKPIQQIAAKIGLSDDDLELQGKYIAKIALTPERKKEIMSKPKGNYVLVTAITPTPAGEGKTTTSIALTQGLTKLGKKAIVTLRQPSLGPVFGIKGGAAGAGYSQVLPMEQINLGFTGDFNKIESAHNLAAAMLDNHLFRKNNELNFDVRAIQYRRVMDMNDRALRNIIVGMGYWAREDGFDITAASEIMAITALAKDLTDLKQRMGEIVLGRNMDGEIIRIRDIKAQGAMAALMKNAVKPNLVQTYEGAPCIIHAGPFANIAHGCSSIIADLIAERLSDYLITEAGFGSDLGAEKFFNIKCRQSGMYPNVVVVVTTVKALKVHGGVIFDREKIKEENPDAVKAGLENLAAHIENANAYGVPVVVALNKFPTDTEEEISIIREFVENNYEKASFAISEGVVKGGEGSVELAQKVIEAAESNPNPEQKFLYDVEKSVEEKIEIIAKQVYGASGVEYTSEARQKIKEINHDGFDKLPICMAKTPLSLSDDASLKGRPSGFTITIQDIRISAGAGFVYPLVGSMLTMPGLPPVPAAENIDIDEDGKITGLF